MSRSGFSQGSLDSMSEVHGVFSNRVLPSISRVVTMAVSIGCMFGVSQTVLTKNSKGLFSYLVRRFLLGGLLFLGENSLRCEKFI